jgi:hypothetical protein
MEDHRVTHSRTAVWVDELNASSVRALRRLRRHDAGRVYYESVADEWISPLRLARLAGLSAQRIDRELGDLRTETGVGLRFAIEQIILEWLPGACDRILAMNPLAHLNEDIPESRARRYLVKAAAAVVRPALTMAFVARATREAREFPQLMVGEVAAELLQGCPALDGFEVRVARSYPRGTAARRIFALLSATRSFLSAARWNLRGITRSVAHVAPQIAVQWHMGLDQSGQLKDCPWLPSSGIDPGRIVVYADRPDSPLDRGDAARIQASGHAWINCRCWGSGSVARGRWSGMCLTGSCRIWMRALRGVAAVSASDSVVILWACARRMGLAWQVSCWEAWCRRHAVGVLITWADTGTTMLAQAIGVERAGGISAAWQWSHYSFDTIDHARDYDVFFAWGPYYLAGFRREGSRIGRLLYVGHVAMRADDDRAPVWRSQLEAAGAARVACLFDSSFGPHIHYSERAVRALYDALLSEVLADPSFGVILKPKNDVTTFVQSLSGFHAAVATGRCLILDPTVSPRAAARAADLVVGFGFNSAAIEAATASRPALHADLSGDRLNPFHASGGGAITFADVDALMQAIRRRLATRSGPVGEHAPLLSAINPFGDSDGARRIGWFLRRYLEAVDAGLGRAAALDQAAAAYQREFDAVVPPDGPVTLELSLAC